MKIDKRFIGNLDWLLLGTVVFLVLCGILTIFSATRPLAEGGHPSFYLKQFLWLFIGIAAMGVVVSFDYIWLYRSSYFLYGIGLLMLFFVMVAGRVGLGAQRWISLGPIGFQPSEFFKLAFVVLLARHMSQIKEPLSVKKLLSIFFALVFVPFILLLKQPDLGTAGVVMILFASMAVVRGIRRKLIILIAAISLISIPFVGNIFWNELKDYQRKRIVVFVNPEVDPAGISYHITQSKVAIGSGGIIGKGYLKGTQGPFRFLPENHTDFVFAVFAEEWGFAGSTLILAAYLILILRGWDTVRKAKDDFSMLLAAGITSMFFIYSAINIGMTMGLMPVVGIPLPFMSYGGTALVSNCIAAGILMNIRARRFDLFY